VDCGVLQVAIVILPNYKGDAAAKVRAHHAAASEKQD
jgi:hypothetical protein